MNPEPIAAALLERIAEVPPVRFSTRYRLGLETLPEMPACVLGMDGAVANASHNHPTIWTLNFKIGFHARVDGMEESPESVLNEWLVNLQDAMAPDDGESVLTLGGLCEHCWIAGEVDYIPPTMENPKMAAWVTVEVLALG